MCEELMGDWVEAELCVTDPARAAQQPIPPLAGFTWIACGSRVSDNWTFMMSRRATPRNGSTSSWDLQSRALLGNLIRDPSPGPSLAALASLSASTENWPATRIGS
jgi:hypothetical protein